MDNTNMPPVQINDIGQAHQGINNQSAAIGQGRGVAEQEVPGSKDNKGVLIAMIIVLALVAMAFAILFIWMLVQYNTVSDDVDGQIMQAVAKAREDQAMKDEDEFAEREKYPYRIFSGPADYGELTFEYPKTWSVYVASDAAKGGDFNAYFNPVQVEAVSNKTINALRLSIRDKSFESVVNEYQNAMNKKDSNLSLDVITVGDTTANRYTGTLPGTELNGRVVIFKIRDKTAVLRTDSVLFLDDFDRLIESISFNA